MQQRIAVAISLLTWTAALSIGQERPLGADYSTLRPEQRVLIDDLVSRYGRMMKQTYSPAKAYNEAPQSQRTTFDAVTHALLNTALTDKAGKSLGTALALVDAVDEIAGERNGEPGDRQFRLYVFLKPGAYETLERSREFKRGPDNSVYHRGYPICFRLPKTPSIQFSLAEDHKRADIDVDYRSSKFPQGLVNGHLTSSNSDVRAGNNEVKHNSRWQGLVAWWKGLFGGEPDRESAKASAGDSLPAVPPKAEGKVEEAVQLFFETWLKDGKPFTAASYFSRDVFPCLATAAAARKEKIERGTTRVYAAQRLAMGLKEKKAGQPLTEYMSGMAPWMPELKPVQHAQESAYLLAQVPGDYVEAMDCDGDPKNNLGKGAAFLAAMRFNYGAGGGQGVGFIWQKDPRFWRIVSVVNLDGGQESHLAQRSKAGGGSKRIEVEGDPEFIKTAGEFARAWWVEKDGQKAVSYLTQEAIACLDANTESAVRGGLSQKRRVLADGLRKAALERNAESLEKAITAPEPAQDGTRVVKHAEAGTQLLVSVADQVEPLMSCGERVSGSELREKLGKAQTFGNIYISAFLVDSAQTPAAFYAAWKKTGAGWRIFFWQVETP